MSTEKSQIKLFHLRLLVVLKFLLVFLSMNLVFNCAIKLNSIYFMLALHCFGVFQI